MSEEVDHSDSIAGLPIGAIALGAVVGLCVGVLSWREFDGMHWGMIYGAGFSANLLYRVARGGVLFGAMIAALLASFGRIVVANRDESAFSVVALAGKMLASFACAMSASMTAGHWLSLLTVARMRFAAVGGLAVWQVASLGLLLALLLAFVALSDFAHRMVRNVHSWRRLALCAGWLSVAVSLPLVMRGLDDVLIASLRRQSAPSEAEPSDKADDYRLPFDEPWDMRG